MVERPCPSTRKPGDRVVHAVEAAQERALAAAGRADHRRDQVLVDLHVDARRAPASCRSRRRRSSASKTTSRAASARPTVAGATSTAPSATRCVCVDVDLGHRSAPRVGSSSSGILRRLRASRARADQARDAGRTPSARAPRAQARAWSSGERRLREGEDRHRDVRQRVPKDRCVTLVRRRSSDVKSSGAVSPAARATARTVPVRMPPSARRQDDAERRAPAAHAERERRLALAARDEQQHLLRRAGDQRQHDDRERDRRRRRPLCWWPTTSRPKTNTPITIDGSPFSRSSARRIGWAERAGRRTRSGRSRRARRSAAPAAVAIPTMIAVPTIAGAIPPPVWPKSAGALREEVERERAPAPAGDRDDDEHEHGRRRRSAATVASGLHQPVDALAAAQVAARLQRRTARGGHHAEAARLVLEAAARSAGPAGSRPAR